MQRMFVMLAVGAVAALTLTACGDSEETADGGGGGAGWERVSPAALQERMASEDVYLVNVHVPYEGEIPETDAFISYLDITSQLDALPDDGSLVIYCRSGNMSTQAAQEMVDAGFTDFAELEGGFIDWEAQGLPFEVNGA